MLRTTSSAVTASSPSIDVPRIERAVREILLALGEDVDREGLRETPERVARAFEELCGGSVAEARRTLAKQFEVASSPEVTVKGISFVSVCEHHLLPFRGRATLTYAPGRRVVGLSKLARALQQLAARPQLQERLTEEYAALVFDATDAARVEVELQATHDCMCLRGVREPGGVMVTRSTRCRSSSADVSTPRDPQVESASRQTDRDGQPAVWQEQP